MIYIGKIENNGFTINADGTNQDPDDSESAFADPLGINRVQLRILSLHSDDIKTTDLPWANISYSLLGGFGETKSGLYFIPDNGVTVYCMLLNDDPMTPIILGAVKGPDDITEDDNYDNTIILKTKTGHTITIDDSLDDDDNSTSKISVVSAGLNEITLDDTKDAALITIKAGLSESSIVIDDTKDSENITIEDKTNENKITLDADGILIEDGANSNTITSSSDGVTIEDTNGNKIEMGSSSTIINDKFEVPN